MFTQFFASIVGARCLHCAGLSGAAICAPCTAKLAQQNGARCPRCAVKLSAARLCGACLKNPPPFAATLCLGSWAAPLDEAIVRLKFQHQLSYARWAGAALWQQLLTHCAEQGAALPQVIVPVALFSTRQQQRGFNQSWEIIKAMPAPPSVEKLPNTLTRLRETATQAHLSEAERWRNMKGAFAADASCAGKTVFLIDDVVTTGATASAAAQALLAAGAKAVIVGCVAKAGSQDNS